jgi:hypothetical protein
MLNSLHQYEPCIDIKKLWNWQFRPIKNHIPIKHFNLCLLEKFATIQYVKFYLFASNELVYWEMCIINLLKIVYWFFGVIVTLNDGNLIRECS